MRDRLTKQRRSWNMSRIRGKDTSPELRVRRLLHGLGFRFRLHQKISTADFRAKGAKDFHHKDTKARSKTGAGIVTTNEHELTQIGNLAEGKHRTSNAQHRTSKQNRKRRAGKEVRSIRFVRPDIVLPKYKTVVFVHGCFWHRHKGCRNCTTPTNNRSFWVKKLEGNAARDKLHLKALRKLGWKCLVVWECQTESPLKKKQLSKRLVKLLGRA